MMEDDDDTRRTDRLQTRLLYARAADHGAGVQAVTGCVGASCGLLRKKGVRK